MIPVDKEKVCLYKTYSIKYQGTCSHITKPVCVHDATYITLHAMRYKFSLWKKFRLSIDQLDWWLLR